MAPRPKVIRYGASVDRDGRIATAGADPIDVPRGWAADDLLLAALCRCIVESLSYHGRRANLEVRAGAEATGVVTKRDDDGRFALTEIACSVEADLEPAPADVEALIAKAERDCFVSASLRIEPSYRWLVNGRDISV